jgi:hypothetical protein
LLTLAHRMTIWVWRQRQRFLREVDPMRKCYLAVVSGCKEDCGWARVDFSGCEPLPLTAMPLFRRQGARQKFSLRRAALQRHGSQGAKRRLNKPKKSPLEKARLHRACLLTLLVSAISSHLGPLLVTAAPEAVRCYEAGEIPAPDGEGRKPPTSVALQWRDGLLCPQQGLGGSARPARVALPTPRR